MDMARVLLTLPEVDGPALHDTIRILSHDGLGVDAVLVHNALRLYSCQAILLQEKDALSSTCTSSATQSTLEGS